MEKLYYYLNRGLWKLAEKYFDCNDEFQKDYFWAVAVHPNHHSFASHIISTPWQQSWMVLNILENSMTALKEKEEELNLLEIQDINILRSEIDFQFTLRDYYSDSFVQQIFSLYSKIQTHIPVSFNESETKVFNLKLKSLFKILLKENPITAHTLFKQMLQHGFFATSCETLLYEVENNQLLCNLIVSCLCETKLIQCHVPQVLKLLQSPLRKELCYLLLAFDNISILHSMIEEDKKFLKSNSKMKLQSLIENGIQPLQSFMDMTILERHFLLQILDLINAHLDDFPSLANSTNIPLFIWPLILLKNLNNLSNSKEVFFRLIKKCRESTKNKIFVKFTYIVEWCIHFYNQAEKEGIVEKALPKVECLEHLLQKSQEHSFLYLINSTTNLSEADWNQIINLLKGDESENQEGKSWDIIVLEGYCILMLALKAIIFSSEISDLAQTLRIKLDDLLIADDIFSLLYKDEVTENLKKVKQMANSLYPLEFRLEILENLFALLFVSYEDVKKLSYFVNDSFNFEKALEKVLVKGKFSFSNEKLNKINAPEFLLQILDKSEEEELSRKQKLKGFICKKYIVRDLIYLIKDCLENLEEDCSIRLNNSETDVPCAIKSVQMENRLDRLIESVSEATWRLQLVTDPDFIAQTNSMKNACGHDPNHNFDGEWVYMPYDTERSGFLKTRKKSIEKLNDSSSQNNSSAGIDNFNPELQSLKQYKAFGHGIINHMLASDSSLVVRCLSQNDDLNADHIVQMMSTEENRQSLEGELNFTRAINDLKKNLRSIFADSSARKNSELESVSISRNLQSFQIVVNQGVSSTVLTNHVERFLSTHSLPSIQSHSKVSAGSVLQCIENTSAMVTIDLALTASSTYQDFKDLFTIASKHCPELNTRVQSPISAQSSSIKPLGYIAFSQNIYQLLQEINRNQINKANGEVSVQKYLRSHHYPFSLKSLKDNINFWKNLNLVYSDFKSNYEESKALVYCKEGFIYKSQKNIKDMQSIFENVIKLSDSSIEFLDLGKSESPTGEMSKTVNYCELLSRYLADLSSFVLENILSKNNDLSEPLTLHNLLERGAVDIVDKLIFDYNVEPSALEKKAQQLGFNLTASLIAGCCPRFPQMFPSLENSKIFSSEYIVLNEVILGYKTITASHPCEVVESILSELLIAFKTYCENKQKDENILNRFKYLLLESDIYELRNDIKIQRILEKTLEINFVKIKLLNNPKEVFLFFTNLLNLMMCHCYLSSKLEKTDGVYSKHSFYRDIGFKFLGYNVGELGFMSIMDVKQKLLGENYDTRFTPKCKEEWSWLHISPDPRLTFVTINFKSSSAPLFLINDCNFDKKIEESVTKYICTSVTVKDNTLIINDLLKEFLEKVYNIKVDIFSLNEKISFFIKFLTTYSDDKLREKISNLSESDIILKIRHSSNEIMLKLDYDVCIPKQKAAIKKSEKWLNRHLNDSILKHFTQNSRILADIVQRIHEAKNLASTNIPREILTDDKSKYLETLFNASWLQDLAPVFHNNVIIAALSKYPEEQNLIEFFESCVENKDWIKCLEVLFALPDYFVFSDINVQRFKDVVLREASFLPLEKVKRTPWYYSQHILNVNMRIETIINCCKTWPGSVCCSELSSILFDYSFLSLETLNNVKNLVKKIKVHNEILELKSDLEAKTWFDVSEISFTSPKLILNTLIKNNQLELCVQWASLPGIIECIQQKIDSEFIFIFFQNFSQETEIIDKLVSSIPSPALINLYDQVVFQLTNISAIFSLVQRAIRVDTLPRFRLVELSLKFLQLLNSDEQSNLIHLISSPLLIIEQLLMNCKLNALEKIFKAASEITECNLLNRHDVNKLLVTYISKALELNLVMPLRNLEIGESLLLNNSTLSIQEQAMPSETPNKSKWVPFEKVNLCMCCRVTIFSMFNKRYHCRRCGRVVCEPCSKYKMEVSGYSNIPVRVCQNCYLYYTKMGEKMKCVQSTDAFDGFPYVQDSNNWKLTTDESKNSIIRQEFFYEFSPNVPLSLAIFDLLIGSDYSRILLDESEKMLEILHLHGKSNNPEVDCDVLLQIIRFLIESSKSKYKHLGLTSEIISCNQLLSQVELLQMLIENSCINFIPSESLKGSGLLYLRNKLIEEELWEEAMEISKRYNLDQNEVWAAWGKVCLAAGVWGEAREKFSNCLFSYPKPVKNPPLLDEICRILESPSSFTKIKGVQMPSDKENTTAQEVLCILSTLKPISQKKSITLASSSFKQSIHYKEEVFYLTTYGSYQSLLLFYVRHNEIKKALSYLLEHQLEPNLFLDNIMLPCYRLNLHEKFKSNLLSLDSSLESFKRYLSYSCVSLQKLKFLHTLYDLQILMQDYIRAAVTCIHLYQQKATSFTDLSLRSSFLHTALKNLEEELAMQSKKNKRLDIIMKMNQKNINCHIKTIWRQLELVKFLSNCEKNDKFTVKDIFPNEITDENEIPTLFDGKPEKIVLAKMTILLGKNISEGFGIGFKIIQDNQLDLKSICIHLSEKLAYDLREDDIKELVDCVKNTGIINNNVIIDEMISSTIPKLIENEVALSKVEPFFNFIKNFDLRIDTFIKVCQLVPDYISAVKNDRIIEIQKILNFSDQQDFIKLKKKFENKFDRTAND